MDIKTSVVFDGREVVDNNCVIPLYNGYSVLLNITEFTDGSDTEIIIKKGNSEIYSYYTSDYENKFYKSFSKGLDKKTIKDIGKILYILNGMDILFSNL